MVEKMNNKLNLTVTKSIHRQYFKSIYKTRCRTTDIKFQQLYTTLTF